jgi:hypothetical protein
MFLIDKRTFFSLFKLAFKEAFTKKNIESAFVKVGIWPFNLKEVLGQLRQRKSLRLSILSNSSRLETPKSCRAVRRVHKAFKQNPKLEILAKILRTNEVFAAQQSIDKHIINGLRDTLRLEKKKHRKGKRLNLLSKDESGPIFWSPSKVHAAKAIADQKEADNDKTKEDIAARKAKKTLDKEQKQARKE